MRRLTLEDMRATGLLQEINRQFLHPLGYALEVDGAPGSTAMAIQDHSDDPEGMIYEDGCLSSSRREAFFKMRVARHRTRRMGLGFVIQGVKRNATEELVDLLTIPFRRCRSTEPRSI